jgi:hypothetical protein
MGGLRCATGSIIIIWSHGLMLYHIGATILIMWHTRRCRYPLHPGAFTRDDLFMLSPFGNQVRGEFVKFNLSSGMDKGPAGEDVQTQHRRKGIGRLLQSSARRSPAF